MGMDESASPLARSSHVLRDDAGDAEDARRRSREGHTGLGIVALVSYIATIFAANWALAIFGVVPVGFGLLAPAGVYFIGLAFPLRDFIQRTMGRRWSITAMLTGAALSAFVTPRFALASGLTFLVSETCDMLVYTPLQRRFTLAVALSSLASLVVDSVLFLLLAFGSLAFLPGQIVGKAWITLATITVMGGLRAISQRRRAARAGS